MSRYVFYIIIIVVVFLLSCFTSSPLLQIFLSPVVGVGVAIGLSLLEFIYRAARPAFPELGRLSGTVVYRDVSTNPSAIVIPGIVVGKFDARLAFYNCNYFQERLEELVEAPEARVFAFVLDASAMSCTIWLLLLLLLRLFIGPP